MKKIVLIFVKAFTGWIGKNLRDKLIIRHIKSATKRECRCKYYFSLY
ncbi:hypothetical protein [Romboutsia sp.]